MILIFGGTTEGRKAVEVLEEGGSPYFYSTKTGEQEITLHHGQRIDGALDAEAMLAFCREHDIRLIVDATHPFASQLHQTIAQVAAQLDLPVVRYERIYPPRGPDLDVWMPLHKAYVEGVNQLTLTLKYQYPLLDEIEINRLLWGYARPPIEKIVSEILRLREQTDSIGRNG